MNGEPFFKAIEAIGKVIFAAIVGAFIMALISFDLGLLNDYLAHHNTRTFAPVMGAILGFLLGSIIGGFVGIIRPNSKNALYFAVVFSAILSLLMLILDFHYLLILYSEGSYSALSSEIIFLIGFGTAFVLSVWVPAKIVPSL